MTSRTQQRLLALEQRISRRVFGNTNQLIKNFGGIAALCAARAQASVRHTSSSAVIAQQISETGFSRPDNPFDPALIAEIRDIYETRIEDDRYSLTRSNRRARKSGYAFSRILKNIPRDLPQVVALLNHDVLDIVTAFYRANLKVVEVLAWRNYNIPNDMDPTLDVFSNRWHIDDLRSDYLKFFILLNDVDETNGPLHVMSKQRTRELLRHGYRHRKSYGLPQEVMNDPKRVVRLTGPAGTTMFCQTPFCLHHAGIPAPGRHRDIIQISFQVAARTLPANWINSLHNPDLESLYSA